MATAKKAAKYPKKGGGGKKSPIVPLYASPIRECIAGGKLRDMKSMASKAHKHISDVQAALAKLEAAIAKHSA